MRTLATCALLAALAATPARAQEAAAPPADSMRSVTLPPALDRVLRDHERPWGARDVAHHVRHGQPEPAALTAPGGA